MMPDHRTRDTALATWADVTMATANATMELASGIMAANLALWDTTLRRAPEFAAAPVADTPSARRSRFEVREPASELRWSSPSPREEHRARSWYRAPYRSPFDPAFWMMPGHPVDHAATWMAPLAAAGIGAMLPRLPSFGFVEPKQQDWLSAWTPPWLRPFLPEPTHIEAVMSAANPGNFTDVSGAFSSYRSAGGHAVAQITQDVMVAAQRSIAEQTASAVLKAWPLPFPLSLWMPR